MSKQTAVEWLTPNILGLTIELSKRRISQRICELEIMKLIEKAKAMEREQMFDYIKNNYVNGEHSLKFHKEEFEQYYNETYKGGEQ